MGTIALDESRWPLIVLAYPRAFDDAEWMHLIDQIVAVLGRGEDFGMINDVRAAPMPTAWQRRKIIDMYETNLVNVKLHWKGTAIIGSSRIVHGILTALQWLMPPPHPAKVFRDVAEGERWVFAQLGRDVVGADPPRDLSHGAANGPPVGHRLRSLEQCRALEASAGMAPHSTRSRTYAGRTGR